MDIDIFMVILLLSRRVRFLTRIISMKKPELTELKISRSKERMVRGSAVFAVGNFVVIMGSLLIH